MYFPYVMLPHLVGKKMFVTYSLPCFEELKPIFRQNSASSMLSGIIASEFCRGTFLSLFRHWLKQMFVLLQLLRELFHRSVWTTSNNFLFTCSVFRHSHRLLSASGSLVLYHSTSLFELYHKLIVISLHLLCC